MSDQQTGLQKDVLSVVSHDLKAPMNAARGFIELVQHVGDLNERQQYFCERALESLEKMQNLLESLLEPSHGEGTLQFQFARCDLKHVIQEKVRLLEAIITQRQITIHQDIDSELGMVWGDEERLGQVVMNLLANAIKYTGDDGHIWIVAINQPELIRISVRDSGQGVPVVDQPYIFDAFYRSQKHEETEGSGLGLAISQTIIHHHRGHIWLESATDAGSTFSFTLPRLRQQTREGYDLRKDFGEGRESGYLSKQETGIETSDAVDDNTQEAAGTRETDSSSDLV